MTILLKTFRVINIRHFSSKPGNPPKLVEKLNKLLLIIRSNRPSFAWPSDIKKEALSKRTEESQHPSEWTNEQTVKWMSLKENALLAYSEKFRKLSVDGKVLLKLDHVANENTLKSIFPKESVRNLFLHELKSLKANYEGIYLPVKENVKIPKVYFPSSSLLLIHIATTAVLYIVMGSFPIISGNLYAIQFLMGSFFASKGFKTHKQTFELMNRIRTPINPRKTVKYLLTTGTFATSRNPTYLGVLYLMLCVSLTTNSVYSLSLLPLNFLLIRFGLVLPEERYLTERFGENYLRYMKKTPRWIGFRLKK